MHAPASAGWLILIQEIACLIVARNSFLFIIFCISSMFKQPLLFETRNFSEEPTIITYTCNQMTALWPNYFNFSWFGLFLCNQSTPLCWTAVCRAPQLLWATLFYNVSFLFSVQITKTRYFHKPTYKTLRSSLECMKAHIVDNSVAHLCIPRIGCGLDRLEWEQVSEMIQEVFHDVSITITVYSL